MASFFESLKRIALGQPVFRKEDSPINDRQLRSADMDQAEQDQSEHVHDGTPLDAHNRKIMPVVIVNEVKCHENQGNMECWGVLKNTSDAPVELKKIAVLNEEHELEHLLNAGEEREFMIYSGPRPRNTSQTRSELTYKNEGGDYFCAEHFVEFDILHDNTCDIKTMRFVPPVRDI